jgi:hypothetical protein
MVLPAKTWLLMASETGGNLALGQAIERGRRVSSGMQPNGLRKTAIPSTNPEQNRNSENQETRSRRGPSPLLARPIRESAVVESD